MQHQLEKIILDVSKELGIPYDVAVMAYMSQWKFIYKKLGEHNYFKMNLEEFKQVRPNFNIPSIGKLNVTEERFLNMKKLFEYIRKSKEDVQDKGDNPTV